MCIRDSQLPKVPSLRPSSRATCAIGRLDSSTIFTASSRYSGENFLRVMTTLFLSVLQLGPSGTCVRRRDGSPIYCTATRRPSSPLPTRTRCSHPEEESTCTRSRCPRPARPCARRLLLWVRAAGAGRQRRGWPARRGAVDRPTPACGGRDGPTGRRKRVWVYLLH